MAPDDLGLKGDSASVRNVWAGKNIGSVNGPFSATVPAQDGLLLIIRGREGDFIHYTPSSASALDQEQHTITDAQTIFSGIAQVSSPFAQVKITFTNPAPVTTVVPLYVNGETSTQVAFPPTASASASVWIQAKLDRSNNRNLLTFATSPTSGVHIESIDIH